MAITYRTSGSGDWASAANWSGGASPTTQSAYVADTISDTITTNMNQSGVGTLAALVVGREFSGILGSAATPLRYDAITTIRVDAPKAQQICVRGTCTTLTVNDCGSNDYGFYYDVTTVTTATINKGRGVRFGSTATVTTLNVQWVNDRMNDSRVAIDSGCTVTTVNQMGGLVRCLAAATTVNIHNGATWVHEGTSTGNVTTFNVYGGGRLILAGKGFTYTTVNLYAGGILDASLARFNQTITTLNAYRNATLIDSKLNALTVTNYNEYGTLNRDSVRTATLGVAEV